MANIEMKNLTMVFGKPKAVNEALMHLENNKTPSEILELTDATVALNNVSLTIEDTELFVIVGLSGSGKSTLIRTLNLLNKPTKGDIIIDGQNIMQLNKEALRAFRRNKISMVFQHFGLLSHRTILKNVEYGLEVQGVDKATREKKAREALEVVGLKGWENKFPHELSGGMKQRVGLARAITTEPEILLMDEPYSALDPLIRREMQNELLNLEDYINRTIVFITHDMNEAFKMGDRIALMKDGEVVQLGTPTDFFNHPANDYVKDFIADVDKTQILKARNIMKKPAQLALLSDTVQDTRDSLIAKDLSYVYVVDDKRKYKGYVLLEDLQSKNPSTLEDVLLAEEPVLRNAYIKTLWERLKDANYSVPVVDVNHRFRGVISNDDIIEALA